MGSLAVMTAAFWSGLTRKDAKYMLLQEDEQTLCASGHVETYPWRLRVRQPSPASLLACRCGSACSNLPRNPTAGLDVFME